MIPTHHATERDRGGGGGGGGVSTGEEPVEGVDEGRQHARERLGATHYRRLCEDMVSPPGRQAD